MTTPKEWFDDLKADAGTEADAPEVPLTRRQRFSLWLHDNTPSFIVTNLLLVLLLIFLWNRVVVVVPPGQTGVLFRLFSGTEVDRVYGEGLYLISPLNTMNLYETRKQVTLHEFEVLTAKGLSVKLALAIRYQPEVEMLGVLHQRIGPDYAQRVIIPQVESVMRKQLGQYVAEDVYTNKDGLLTRAILAALDEVGRNFIQVEDIIIRSIQLPDKLKAAIEDKLTQEEMLKSYEFRMETARKEAERLTIEAEGHKKHNAIVAETLTDKVLQREQIAAMRDLAKSPNAKTLIMGSGQSGAPGTAQGDPKLMINVTP
ncbi:prohibitin family protein [Sphaerotilus montanus]|uniref:Regulator of protease activity HflC (Stomatin/prohibitin superfamily) n=1 Tax=Sphaerotilus montanus TaxID=522889 RepID=A0A7Y9U989_9BURK|nr:prohibitin family protein [Sphaerotilus montanus]NYG35456.1 regulator of protease activity HflC (stomatin/prohibitin superfamily) [Sphaerotilus montanus]NZD57203.1 prohibitin family protein [Sphaerotilus montanus]